MLKEPIFKCGICGKDYPSVEERMKCETKCLTELKKDMEIKKAEKLRKEKDSRLAAVKQAYIEADKKYNDAKKLEQKYEEDYNMISFNSRLGNIEEFMEGIKTLSEDTSIRGFFV